MRWRRLAASVWPTDTDSTKPTTLISSAGTASCCHSARSHSGRVNGGRPCGMWPTIFTPCACQPKAQARPVVTAMAATGPALVSMSAVRAARPRRTSSGLSPLRTQNRKAVAHTPTSQRRQMGVRQLPGQGQQQVHQGVAVGLHAQQRLQLAGGDQQCRRGDEARDHRMAEEVGQEAQPQQPHGQQHGARQEGQRDGGGPVGRRAGAAHAGRWPPPSSARPRPPAPPPARGWCRTPHTAAAAPRWRTAPPRPAGRPAAHRPGSAGSA
jgi:hypothetical protein